MTDQSNASVSAIREFVLDKELEEWLRSPQGLSRLTSCWRTALYIFHKHGYFGSDWNSKTTLNAYKELKEYSYVVGLKVAVIDLTNEEEVEELEELAPGELAKTGRKEVYLSGDFAFIIQFYIALDFSRSCADHFNAIVDDDKQLLARNLWDMVSKEKPVYMSPRLTCPTYEVRNPCGEGPMQEEEERVWKWEDTSSYDYDRAVNYSMRAEIKVVTNDEQHRRLCGLSFIELSRLVSKYRPSIDPGLGAEASGPGGVFKGVRVNHWESKLASYLLSEGFIVSLQPEILFPSPNPAGHRIPDLVVYHKGRALAIKIDDASHLVYTKDDLKNGRRKGQINIEKWERDRVLDQLFLCNGIPVLRVWFSEVENSPEEEVMSKVLKIYQSLGDSRMSYR